MSTMTFAMIKSHAILQGNSGAIMNRIGGSFEVRGLASGTMDPELMEEFYAEHKGRPYWDELMKSVSGPVIAFALSADVGDAVRMWRKMMGATNCRQAEAGTIRAMFGDKTGPVSWNAVHGSDSPESAARELALFFPHVQSWGV